MPTPAEVEIARIAAVVRGLGWDVAATVLTASTIEVRLTKPTPPETTPIAPTTR